MATLLSHAPSALISLLGISVVVGSIICTWDAIIRRSTALIRSTRLFRNEFRRSIRNRRSEADRRTRTKRRVHTEPITFPDRRVEVRRQRPDRWVYADVA